MKQAEKNIREILNALGQDVDDTQELPVCHVDDRPFQHYSDTALSQLHDGKRCLIAALLSKGDVAGKQTALSEAQWIIDRVNEELDFRRNE